MKKTATKVTRKTNSEAQSVEVTGKSFQLTVALPELFHEELYGVVTRLGLLALQGMLQHEVAGLCGPRYLPAAAGHERALPAAAGRQEPAAEIPQAATLPTAALTSEPPGAGSCSPPELTVPRQRALG